MDIKIDFPLKKYNTFGIEANADEYIEFDSLVSLQRIFSVRNPKKWYVLGGGSNTLFTKNYHGLIIRATNRYMYVVEQDDKFVKVVVGAGAAWDDFVKWSVDRGFYGTENLSAIPGSVGASPVQNIGAYGSEAKDVIDSVEFFVPESNEVLIYNNDQCEFGYRDSVFKRALKDRIVILNVTFKLSRKFAPNLSYGNISSLFSLDEVVTASTLRDKIVAVRAEKLPDHNVLGNAGSFFKNPVVSVRKAAELVTKYHDMPKYPDPNGVKLSAAWLIDRCGWKGRCIGNVGVHDKQALVIVNCGLASAQEVVDLSAKIIEDVALTFGVEISPEVNFIE